MSTTKDELRKAGVLVLPPVAPEHPESQMIMQRLETLGFTFRLNLCSDSVEVNGRKISDVTAAEIRVALRDIGLSKKIPAAEDAYIAAAKRDAYHPIKEYLSALKWDGNDHISRLTGYMESSDPPIVYASGVKAPLHHVYIYRWLIGAVAKALDAHQLAMLVLDGVQDLGKSSFARWLCGGMPDYFIESAIKVEDKDTEVRLIDRWIWEVSELDATTRKADQSALKAFITRKEVTVRKAYGRYEITKPALAALVGTLNNSTGFLTDDTGNRRFMITWLTSLDFRYADLDVNQVWAQAVHLYRDNEPWKLVGEERTSQRDINKRYEVETVLSDWLDKFFVFDPEADDKYSLADILRVMDSEYRPSGSERSQAMELARVLTSKGAKKVETRIGKRWIGILQRIL
jgi:predicted P-loop ATPase